MERKIDETMRLAYFYTRHLKVFDPYSAALMILMDLCIPTNCEGHDYLLDSIVERYRYAAMGIEKGFYILDGARYRNVSAEQMEVAVRYVIKKAWRHRNEQTWACFFPRENSGRQKRPSNTEFISDIANFMRLWERCYEGVGCHEK